MSEEKKDGSLFFWLWLLCTIAVGVVLLVVWAIVELCLHGYWPEATLLTAATLAVGLAVYIWRELE